MGAPGSGNILQALEEWREGVSIAREAARVGPDEISAVNDMHLQLVKPLLEENGGRSLSDFYEDIRAWEIRQAMEKDMLRAQVRDRANIARFRRMEREVPGYFSDIDEHFRLKKRKVTSGQHSTRCRECASAVHSRIKGWDGESLAGGLKARL
ncbi:unnamed protein product [Peniophora sp. CBMAI 1063]|nr:unnamed protein product [Peniophora sp. CBMAI 1063]